MFTETLAVWGGRKFIQAPLWQSLWPHCSLTEQIFIKHSFYDAGRFPGVTKLKKF